MAPGLNFPPTGALAADWLRPPLPFPAGNHRLVTALPAPLNGRAEGAAISAPEPGEAASRWRKRRGPRGRWNTGPRQCSPLSTAHAGLEGSTLAG